MPKQAKKSSLGRTLVKDRFGAKGKNVRGESMLHAADLGDGADWNRLNLRSITEASTLDDFLATAQLAGTEFTAARLNMSFVPPTSKQGLLTPDEKEALQKKHDELKYCLKIPRRPPWNATTTPEELDMLERESFLEWRRRLAALESGPESIIFTPFEKNLEFWRQLWRVVERSDVVVQIVDARNPLLFRCEDLEHYVEEVSKDKKNVILVNKADFLSRKQRDMWADYFSKQGVRAIFFSATNDVAEKDDADVCSGPEDESDDESVAVEEAKKQASSNVKPGSLGLDAYYADLDTASSLQKKSTKGPDEDEHLKSDSDEELPYLVEAPLRSDLPGSSGHPEVDAMRIYGDPTAVSKTILNRAKETRKAAGQPTGDLNDALLALKANLPVHISEDQGDDEWEDPEVDAMRIHGDPTAVSKTIFNRAKQTRKAAGQPTGDLNDALLALEDNLPIHISEDQVEDEWEDVDSDEEMDNDSVVDECYDEEGVFVLKEEDIAEIITLDDDDEPPISSDDEDDVVGEDGNVAMKEEDIAEVISLDGGEPPSSSDDDEEDDVDDEEMEEFDEEEYQRKLKEEKKAAVQRQVELMYEQRRKLAEEREKKKVHREVNNSGRCLDREQLVKFFEKIHAGCKKVGQSVDGRPAPVTIGLVGYPNVGKSSTINSVLQSKKVSVSTTPGKTKHFQTIFLNKDVILCDCPGLVMPSFLSTKAEMVIAGILPIDNLRDHVPPINLVASLIPKHVLEKTYGVLLPKPEETEDPNRPPTSEELLNAIGFLRGYMTQRGLPDNPRTARYLLKDFVNGKLLYCHPPPDSDKAAFEAETKRNYNPAKDAIEEEKRSDMPASFKRMVKGCEGTAQTAKEIDATFFLSTSKGVHKKGPTCVKNSMESELASSCSGSEADKPWKKHGNRNRKEKLRRVYAHLDN